jgi:hypothetical protein
MGGQRSTGDMLDIPPHVQLLITGDYHQAITTRVERRDPTYPPLCVLSPGAIAMQDISEPPDKYFYVVGKAGDEWRVEGQQLQTRPATTVNVQTPEEVGNLSTAFPTVPDNSDDKPLIRFRYPANRPELYALIGTTFANRAHVFYDPVGATGAFDDAALEPVTPETAAEDLMQLVLHERLPSPASDVAQQLWVAADIRETYKQLFDTFMASQ